MTDSKEIELKLQFDLSDLATLLADPAFADHHPISRDQVSVYFDTDKRTLHAAGLSLRIRTTGDKRIQTIKTESEAAASLFARGEWERSVSGDAPELGDAPSILVGALANAKSPQLAAIFSVEVNRTTVVHETGADRVELVADRGRVVIVGDERPIAEIELELLDGSRAALFELAHRLAKRLPLRLGVQSKSERGYALLTGKAALSVKAEPITLSRDGDTERLFEAIAGACIRQFRLNEDKLLVNAAPGSVHQARVALRRLRTALSLFKAMLKGPEFERFQTGFRNLAGTLGTVRDVDVMIDKIDHEAALDRLRAARTERYDAAVQTLNSDAVRTLMLDFVRWLSIGEWRTREATRDLRVTPAQTTAARMLDTLRRKIKRRGAALSALDEHDRHRVRIVGKKHRYAAEFFADLHPGKKASHRRDRFLDAIGDLQTALGHLNDLASGRSLFDDLGIPNADAILATGKKANTKKLLTAAERAHHDLLDIKRFWR